MEFMSVYLCLFVVFLKLDPGLRRDDGFFTMSFPRRRESIEVSRRDHEEAQSAQRF
jgi:hypothetical protein